MPEPLRIQRRRTKGWRLPPNTVVVSRPHRWGNPWRIGGPLYDDATNSWRTVETAADAVQGFRQSVDWDPDELLYLRTEDSVLEIRGGYGPMHRNRKTIRAELRGRNLACWCRLCPAHKDGKPFDLNCPDCAPCHADVLGRIANGLRCEAA